VGRTSGRVPWAKLITGNASRMTTSAIRAWSRATAVPTRPTLARQRVPARRGDWLVGLVLGVSGTRRYRLFRPAGIKFGEKLPLIVMLHGCNQDANRFAACTRMNVVAARERFLDQRHRTRVEELADGRAVSQHHHRQPPTVVFRFNRRTELRQSWGGFVGHGIVVRSIDGLGHNFFLR